MKVIDEGSVPKQVVYKQLDLFSNNDIEKEIKIPEKLNYELEYMTSSNGFLLQYCIDFLRKINEIIDYLDYLKSKGE